MALRKPWQVPWQSQLNVMAAAGIVLGGSLVACKEKKVKIKVWPASRHVRDGFQEPEKKEKKQLAPGALSVLSNLKRLRASILVANAGFKEGEPEIKFSEVKKRDGRSL